VKTTAEKSKTGRAAKTAGRAGKADAGTEQLKKLSKKLGNTQVQALIGKNDAARDQIYQFILHRLQKLHSIQLREKQAMKKQRVWFDEVAHKKAGFGLPDPTRWRESAGEYKQAAQSLSRGNLGQAVDHLDRAMEAERRAMEDLPKQVPLDHHDVAVERPAASVGVNAGEGCTPREVIEAVHLAETIERESDKSEAAGLYRMRKPWWGEVGEDDEKKEDKKADKPGAKKGERAEEAGAEKTAAGPEAEMQVEQQPEREPAAKDLRPQVEEDLVAAAPIPYPGQEPAPPARKVKTGVKRK